MLHIATYNIYSPRSPFGPAHVGIFRLKEGSHLAVKYEDPGTLSRIMEGLDSINNYESIGTKSFITYEAATKHFGGQDPKGIMKHVATMHIRPREKSAAEEFALVYRRGDGTYCTLVLPDVEAMMEDADQGRPETIVKPLLETFRCPTQAEVELAYEQCDGRASLRGFF